MSEGGNSGLSSVGPFTRLFGACVAASFCTGALALLIGMAVVGVLVSFMLRSEQDFNRRFLEDSPNVQRHKISERICSETEKVEQ